MSKESTRQVEACEEKFAAGKDVVVTPTLFRYVIEKWWKPHPSSPHSSLVDILRDAIPASVHEGELRTAYLWFSICRSMPGNPEPFLYVRRFEVMAGVPAGTFIYAFRCGQIMIQCAGVDLDRDLPCVAELGDLTWAHPDMDRTLVIHDAAVVMSLCRVFMERVWGMPWDDARRELCEKVLQQVGSVSQGIRLRNASSLGARYLRIAAYFLSLTSSANHSGVDAFLLM